MPIKIQQPGLAKLYAAAAVISKREAEARKELDRKMEFDYNTALKQQDMEIDLQMNHRAKMWEIEKMEITSRMRFEEEERKRKRKADETQAKLDALEKAFEGGVIDEEERKKLIARLTTGIPFPVTERAEVGIPPWWTDPKYATPEYIGTPEAEAAKAAREKAARERAGFGVAPHWMAGKDAPEGTPEKILYDAEMKRRTEGRAGTIPYHLSPEFLRTLPLKTAKGMLMDKGIFFDSDEDFEAWLVNLESATRKETESPADRGIDIEEDEEDIEAMLQGLGEPSPDEVITEVAPPIYANNPTTGERIVSYDNGETWKPVEKESKIFTKGIGVPQEQLKGTIF